MYIFYLSRTVLEYTKSFCFVVGAVFRRSSSNPARTTVSNNGVGSSQISWQGYEVITGRINSPNLG